MAAAREIAIADEPATWAALGFAPDGEGVVALGELAVRLEGRAVGAGVIALRVDGLVAERPDGLPVVPAGAARDADALPPRSRPPRAARDADALPPRSRPPRGEGTAGGTEHPNGAFAIDHLVVLTDDRDRTAEALAAAGGDIRRRGAPPELPAPMAFVRFGPLIVEVAQAGGPARFWGLTVTVHDLDALAGPLVGEVRGAVQPGRRIATVRRDAGLSLPLALMSS